MLIISYSCLFRLRRLVSEHEQTIRVRDETIRTLNKELERKQREVQQQGQVIRELKDLLETSVRQTKPADIRHRMGMCGEGNLEMRRES